MREISPPLKPYEVNYTSQSGEDGVLKRALEILPSLNRWCVEFGAWDGKHLSNTYALIDKAAYSAVLIEANPEKFSQLKKTYVNHRNVIPLNRFVNFEGDDSLDCILASTPIPQDFDLLSIDIDGNDYHTWDSLIGFKPKIVVIEFNPSIPNEIDFVQPRNHRIAQGASLGALCRLGKSKNYELVHATTTNGIFVDEKYFSLFGIDNNDPACLRADLSKITYFFQTFDGRIHIVGNDKLLWHDLPMIPAQLQILPQGLQNFPSGYSFFQRVWWKIYSRYFRLKMALFLRDRGRDNR